LEYITGFTAALIMGVIFYIIRSWISERLRVSIKHDYNIKLLKIEEQQEMRLKGEIVAELLAEWIRKSGSLDYHQLNKLSFQAFVWLPKELAEELSKSLSLQPDSQDVRSLIKNIRTHLQGEDDGMESKHVIVFREPE